LDRSYIRPTSGARPRQALRHHPPHRVWHSRRKAPLGHTAPRQLAAPSSVFHWIEFLELFLYEIRYVEPSGNSMISSFRIERCFRNSTKSRRGHCQQSGARSQWLTVRRWSSWTQSPDRGLSCSFTREARSMVVGWLQPVGMRLLTSFQNLVERLFSRSRYTETRSNVVRYPQRFSCAQLP
jgi:hypothetical protein